MHQETRFLFLNFHGTNGVSARLRFEWALSGRFTPTGKCHTHTGRQDLIIMNDPVHHDNPETSATYPAVAAELDPKIQAAIGRAVKAHYDDLVNAPIPDRLLALLAELEAKEQGHGG
jgi:Anti-sigma factor NepR